ncbi:MAG: hypothetical protein AAF693_19275 [Bacteroidota bacterium]
MEVINFEPGQMIRSYDFPGVNRKHCFIEGEILGVDQEGGWLEVKVEFNSMEDKTFSRVSYMVTVPIHTELDRLWGYNRIEVLSNK